MKPKFEIGQVVYLLDYRDQIQELTVQGIVRYGSDTAESEYRYILEEEHDEYEGKEEYNEAALFFSKENLINRKVEEFRKKLENK